LCGCFDLEYATEFLDDYIERFVFFYSNFILIFFGVLLCVLHRRRDGKLLRYFIFFYGLLILVALLLGTFAICDFPYTLQTFHLVFGLLLTTRTFVSLKAEYGFKPPKLKETLLLGLLATLAAAVAALGFVTLIKYNMVEVKRVNLYTVPKLGVEPVLTLLFGFLPLAFLEELFFRGFVQGELKAYFKNVYFPVIITNLVFGFIHLEEPVFNAKQTYYFSLAFVIGVFLSWARERTGSIVTTTICHTLVNLNPILLVLVTCLC